MGKSQQHKRSPSELNFLNYCYGIPEATDCLTGTPVSFHTWCCAQHNSNCKYAACALYAYVHGISRELTGILHSVQWVNVLTEHFCGCQLVAPFDWLTRLRHYMNEEEVIKWKLWERQVRRNVNGPACWWNARESSLVCAKVWPRSVAGDMGDVQNLVAMLLVEPWWRRWEQVKGDWCDLLLWLEYLEQMTVMSMLVSLDEP